MNLHTNTSMIGEYNYSKPKLIVDKICGDVYASLGIDKGDNGYFYPKSTLQEDIRKLVTSYDIVEGIMIKNRNEKVYKRFTKNKLKVAINDLPDDIKKKIDI
jgi:hypothetical protein